MALAYDRILLSLQKEGDATIATAWINQENFILSETTQSQKNKDYLNSLPHD